MGRDAQLADRLTACSSAAMRRSPYTCSIPSVPTSPRPAPLGPVAPSPVGCYRSRVSSVARKLLSIEPPAAVAEDQIPDGYELLHSVLVEKETSGRHGRAAFGVAGALSAPFNRRPGGARPGGWWFAAETLVDFGEGNKLRPDVAGWRRERSSEPIEPIIRVTPDWVCEILSPGNANNDTVKKRRLYHQRRVGHFWILEPVLRRLDVYRWHSDGYLQMLTAEAGERVRAEPFDAVELAVGELFGDIDD